MTSMSTATLQDIYRFLNNNVITKINDEQQDVYELSSTVRNIMQIFFRVQKIMMQIQIHNFPSGCFIWMKQ